MEELDRKVWGKVFGREALFALYHLHNRGIFHRLGGAVAEGKESKVFVAWNDVPLAVKIYRIDASAFESIRRYIRGDPRFWNVGRKKRDVIFSWVRKEYGNLNRLFSAGVSVPRPYAFRNNVLVMQFVGDEIPAPTLREADCRDPDLFWAILQDVRKMYRVARLVHADLSEYNILVWEGRHYIIDVGQAVDLRHPGAEDFLRRDLQNLARFFNVQEDVNDLIGIVKGEESGDDR